MATYLQALNYCKTIARIRRDDFPDYESWNKCRNLRDRQMRRLKKHFSEYEKRDTVIPCLSVGLFTIHLNGECHFNSDDFMAHPATKIYASFHSYMLHVKKLETKNTGVTLET